MIFVKLTYPRGDGRRAFHAESIQLGTERLSRTLETARLAVRRFHLLHHRVQVERGGFLPRRELVEVLDLPATTACIRYIWGT